MISWEQSFSLACKLNLAITSSYNFLRYHKLRHTFNCSNPSCLCLTGTEDNEHFLLHCPRFATQRRDLRDLVSSLTLKLCAFLQKSCLKAIFHQADFSARSDIFFCLKTNWRRVGVKRQKKISFRAEKFRIVENDPNLLLYGHSNFTLVTDRAIVESTIKFIKSTRRFKRN